MLKLEYYFNRIDYKGSFTSPLETLQSLMLCHTQSIPFENLNPFLKWPMNIGLPSIEQKLIHQGRGGYCYEQNSLFKHVLEVLGFSVTSLSARVLLGEVENQVPPSSHMLLLTEVNGSAYLVDVGFGAQTPTWPLLLDSSDEQITPHGIYQVIRSGDEYKVQTKLAGIWKPIYTFDLCEKFLSDYEIFNWFFSTHPSSLFVTDLVAARPSSGKRNTLLNRVLSIYHSDGTIEKRSLNSTEELRKALTDTFLIRLPDSLELDKALHKI